MRRGNTTTIQTRGPRKAKQEATAQYEESQATAMRGRGTGRWGEVAT
jgi:hypothetical protein